LWACRPIISTGDDGDTSRHDAAFKQPRLYDDFRDPLGGFHCQSVHALCVLAMIKLDAVSVARLQLFASACHPHVRFALTTLIVHRVEDVAFGGDLLLNWGKSGIFP
jgi:hypothetical protein